MSLPAAIIESTRIGVNRVLSERSLKQALARAGLSAPVRFDEVTGSTNETALELAAAGTPEWTLVATGHQTAGRGRLGRSWEDRAGDALLFSIVLRPELEPGRAGLLSLLAGWAMAEACREACGVEVACRWPNDLVIADRKVGGILAESRVGAVVRHVVLGIGVNLARAPSGVDGAGAVGPCDPAELLAAFLQVFERRYEPTHPAFAGAVLAGYRQICATIGREVRATEVGGIAVEGRAVGVDEVGGLVVETRDGPRTIAFGEIEHLER